MPSLSVLPTEHRSNLQGRNLKRQLTPWVSGRLSGDLRAGGLGTRLSGLRFMDKG